MPEPGEQLPPDRPGTTGPSRPVRPGVTTELPARSPARSRALGPAALLAAGAGLATALAWALLRGVLELGPGAVVVAGLGGWGIGAAIRSALGPQLLAVALAGLTWLVGLLLTWVLAMALLPGSTRSFVERLAATPFLEWLAPQLGLIEVAALVVLVAVAAWTARPSRSAAA